MLVLFLFLNCNLKSLRNELKLNPKIFHKQIKKQKIEFYELERRHSPQLLRFVRRHFAMVKARDKPLLLHQ